MRPARQSVVMYMRLRGRCGLGRAVVVFWGALDDVGGVVLSDAPGFGTMRDIGGAIEVVGE